MLRPIGTKFEIEINGEIQIYQITGHLNLNGYQAEEVELIERKKIKPLIAPFYEDLVIE